MYSANNVNSSFIAFTIDITYPEISITNPVNNTNYSSATFDLNYTYTETNIDFCWYSNDSGVTNSSTVTMGTNWTDLTDSEGDRNRTIYCNDSSNNINSSIIFFTIDTTYPVLNFTSLNTTSGSKTIEFYADTNDTNLDTCWYAVLDIGEGVNVTNTSYTCDTRATPTVTAFGTYNLTIYANDSAGNTNSTREEFTTSAAVVTVPGGGGGGTTVIVAELGNWSMETDTGAEKYQFNMIPGGSRTRKILLENFEDTNRTIEFLCSGSINDTETSKNLCEYLTLPSEPLELPVQKEIKEEIEFTITLPEDLEEGRYITNVVGLDDLGRLNTLTIEVNVGDFEFLTEVSTKLSSSREIFGLPIPYIVIGLFSWAILGTIIYFVGLKKVSGGFAWALIGGLFGAVFIVFIF
jgi:hypothetical protein